MLESIMLECAMLGCATLRTSYQIIGRYNFLSYGVDGKCRGGGGQATLTAICQHINRWLSTPVEAKEINGSHAVRRVLKAILGSYHTPAYSRKV